ncbi:hypothetical protein CR513_21923, partial [Mucuna pruriens]
MVDTASKDEDDELIDLNHLQMAYQELFSNSSTLSVGYKDLKKKFSKLSKEFDSLQKENDLLKKENGINEQLHEEVIDLRQCLAKFVNGSKNLKKTNKKGPNRIWVPKNMIIHVQIFFRIGRRSQSWYLDNDCSCHMAGERFMFQDLRPMVKAKFIEHKSMCDSGYDVSFNKGECIVKNPYDLTNQSVTCLVSINNDQCTWHKKLRHVRLRFISKLKKHNLVRRLQVLFTSLIFHVMHIRKGNKLEDHLNPKILPLDLLHINLFGPTKTAYEWKTLDWLWLMTILDGHGLCSLPIRMSHSNSSLYFLKEFKMKKVLTLPLLKNNHGGEFKNENFQKLCEKRGILHNFFYPRTPQHNGVVERKNKPLQEMARTMLNDFNSPKCECFILNTKDNMGMFDPKSDKGTFLGYSNASKSYKI